ncbi:MAG TPA: VWA domain-containing protein [Pirellulales bacterium]|nr:VWA domain-containing protein [Pirellulales bacterium]
MNREPDREGFSFADTPAVPSSNGEPHDEQSLDTAYALGELHGDLRAEVEARVHESSAGQPAIEELSRLGKLLRKVSEEGPLPDRSPALREAVLAELAHPRPEVVLRLPERFPPRRIWLRLSLAASLAILCGTLATLSKTKQLERAVADHDAIAVLPAEVDKLVDLEDTTTEYAGEQEWQTVEGFGLSNGIADHDFAELRLGVSGPEGTTADAGGPMLSDAWEGMDGKHEETSRSFFSFAAGGKPGQGPSKGEGKKLGLGGYDPATKAEVRQELKARMSTRNTKSDGQSIDGEQAAEQGEHDGRGKSGGGQRANGDQNSAYGFGDLLVGGEGQPDDSRRGWQAAGAGEQGLQAELKAAKADLEEVNRQYRVLKGVGRAESKPETSLEEVEQKIADAKTRLAAASAAAGLGRTEGVLHAYDYAESYAPLVENSFRKPTDQPLSTFSVDVDTASYTNVRRFLSSRALPPADAVRVEELINYFQYGYPQPDDGTPFSVTTDVADCPWNAERRLLRVGLKGRDLAADQRPASNLVFLLDVSGSMDAPNKLPLVKEAMYLLTDKLTENDRVAIVVYAGNSGLVLPPTNGLNKGAIRGAIEQLVASGSTNGGQGLQMAYETAQSQFIKGGTNRVILATDGDFNVGMVNQEELVRFIGEKAKGGVFLSALGFGVGNLKDGTLEKLADKGNGNYAYIDTLGEARRVLVEQLAGTLVTIAKDVKLQIEFNPGQVAEYRLIGYENRVMPHQDFHDDRKDAGEIGAGHTVTALYEIVPTARGGRSGGEPLKYQRADQLTPAADSDELATLKLRYKQPDGDESRLIERVVADVRPQQAAASSDFYFAAAVAQFGLLLRESPYRGSATYKSVLALAEQGLSNDPNGYRSEFLQLVRQARDISGKE